MDLVQKSIYAAANVCLYKKVLKDAVVEAYVNMLRALSEKQSFLCFSEAYSRFIELLYGEGSNHIGQQLRHCLIYDENTYTASVMEQTEPDYLRKTAEGDLFCFNQFLETGYKDIVRLASAAYGSDPVVLQLISQLPVFENRLERPLSLEALRENYRKNGVGIYGKYYAFVWQDGRIQPVKKPEVMELEEYVGYESQRQVVIDNTEALAQGFQANNVLLYGDRGSGKSSTVKSVAKHFRNQGVRLIELPSAAIGELTKMASMLPDYYKYIIFIDDLSFENNYGDFSGIKAILEGSLQASPRNIALYATSNRRHLVKETFGDRMGDEVHVSDTIQESLSLSDRFGITVTFTSPTSQEFADMAVSMLHRRGIEMEEEEIRREANRWEMRYNGRSGRTARQFVDYMVYRQKKTETAME